MTRITLDASVASRLHELTEPAQLCDPSGRVLGEFVPAFDPSKWEIVGPEPTEEELQRREQSTEWYTTEEALAHLKSLPKTEDQQRPDGEEAARTRITLDAAAVKQLYELSQPVQLCDPSGRVLGEYVPAVDLSEWEPVTPEVSDEELARRAASKEKRYTTAEVLAFLEKL